MQTYFNRYRTHSIASTNCYLTMKSVPEYIGLAEKVKDGVLRAR